MIENESKSNENSCSICGKDLYSESYCEACYIMLKLLNEGYNTKQLMTLFSHSIGTKIVQNLTETMANDLKVQYNLKTGNSCE